MRSDEIDRRPRAPAQCGEQVRVASDAAGDGPQWTVSIVPMVAYEITVPVIPFSPRSGERADLVAAGADIPRLGDELDLGENRVLGNSVEKDAMGIECAVASSCKRGCQVKSEPINMEFLYPIAKGIEGQLGAFIKF